MINNLRITTYKRWSCCVISNKRSDRARFFFPTVLAVTTDQWRMIGDRKYLWGGLKSKARDFCLLYKGWSRTNLGAKLVIRGGSNVQSDVPIKTPDGPERVNLRWEKRWPWADGKKLFQNKCIFVYVGAVFNI